MVIDHMIKIAICDDIKEHLENLCRLTGEYFIEKNLASEVKVFSHPNDLLNACENDLFHIYILDIVMPMINGIFLGKEIRLSDKEAQIIYTTTEPQFALDSFAANPINYLLKPIQKQKLYDTLSLAVSKVKNYIDKSLCIRTSDFYRNIAFSEIVFCEYNKHIVIYTLQDGETVKTISNRIPFSEHIMPLIKDNRFLQPHTSFVINMHKVKRMTKDAFEMQGGYLIPIAQKRKSQARDAYLEYILGKGGNIV